MHSLVSSRNEHTSPLGHHCVKGSSSNLLRRHGLLGVSVEPIVIIWFSAFFWTPVADAAIEPPDDAFHITSHRDLAQVRLFRK